MCALCSFGKIYTAVEATANKSGNTYCQTKPSEFFWRWTTPARHCKDSSFTSWGFITLEIIIYFLWHYSKPHLLCLIQSSLLFLFFSAQRWAGIYTVAAEIHKLPSPLGTRRVFNQDFCDKAVWSGGQQTSSTAAGAGWWWHGHDATEIRGSGRREERTNRVIRWREYSFRKTNSFIQSWPSTEAHSASPNLQWVEICLLSLAQRSNPRPHSLGIMSRVIIYYLGSRLKSYCLICFWTNFLSAFAEVIPLCSWSAADIVTALLICSM